MHQQKVVTTVGRLPKMAAHVVLAPNQPERAAAMHGKALVLSALLLATDICSTSAQSLFDQRVKCQQIAMRWPTLNSLRITENLSSNLDSKLGHCYVLNETISSDGVLFTLYDGITRERLAFTAEGTKKDGSINKFGQIYDKNYNGSYKLSFEYTEKYIADKMNTER